MMNSSVMNKLMKELNLEPLAIYGELTDNAAYVFFHEIITRIIELEKKVNNNETPSR